VTVEDVQDEQKQKEVGMYGAGMDGEYRVLTRKWRCRIALLPREFQVASGRELRYVCLTRGQLITSVVIEDDC